MKEKIVTWGLGGLLVVLIGLNLWWMMSSSGGGHALVDKPAPEISLPMGPSGAEGASMFTLSDQRGKVVLLDFWAVYCGPCKRQMPILEELRKEMVDQDVQIISVNTDDPREKDRRDKIERFVAKGGFAMPVALDTGVAAYNFGVERIPTLVLVDKAGTVRFVHTGVSSKSELKAEIDKLLANEGA